MTDNKFTECISNAATELSISDKEKVVEYIDHLSYVNRKLWEIHSLARTCQKRYDKISELEAEVRELKHKLRVSDEYGKDMLDEVVALRESGATLPKDLQ